MSEPISPDDTAVGKPERLHPLFLLTGLGGSLRGLAGGYAAVGYLAVSGRLETALFAAIALVVLMTIGIILYWTRFSFRVGENEVRIDSGIISRTHRSIPYARIQDVDISQGPIARLLGLAQVKFETGGSGGQVEAALPAITLERAQQIRRLIRERHAATADPALAEAAGEAALPVYAMSPRRLMLAGTFNFSLAVLAGLFGVTQTYGDVVGFDPLSRRFWTGIFSADHPIASYILGHRIIASVAGVLLLISLGLLTGIVRTVLRDYGFRLDRTPAGLRRRRGLLTRTDVTMPIARAQAVILRSGPVRDRFGWSEVRLQSLARDDSGRGDHVLAPLATSGEANTIVGELRWRPVPQDLQWTPVSRAWVWSLAVGLAPAILLAALALSILAVTPLFLDPSVRGQVLQEFGPAILPVAVLFFGLVAAIGMRALAWRRTRFCIDGDRLLVRSGWWGRRLRILPVAKIQSIEIAENSLSRMFGIAEMRFGVGGGRANSHIIPAIPRDDARTLRDRLLNLLA